MVAQALPRCHRVCAGDVCREREPTDASGMGRMSHDSRHRVAHHSSMRVDRGYLFWGVFFVLLGAIPLAERQGWIDVGGLGDVGRLWPLIIIGIGIAILASRTRLALVATVVGALVLGTLAGTALASFGGGVFECVRTGEPQLQRTTQDGTLGPESAVRLDIDCGDLDVRTAPGTVWTLDAGHAGDPPRVEASATQLRIRPADGVARRQDWALVVPGALDTLDLDANASSATLQLEGATLGRLRTSINAGDLRVVAPTGRMESLVIDVNAGDVDLLAPSTDITNSRSMPTPPPRAGSGRHGEREHRWRRMSVGCACRRPRACISKRAMTSSF